MQTKYNRMPLVRAHTHTYAHTHTRMHAHSSRRYIFRHFSHKDGFDRPMHYALFCVWRTLVLPMKIHFMNHIIFFKPAELSFPLCNIKHKKVDMGWESNGLLSVVHLDLIICNVGTLSISDKGTGRGTIGTKRKIKCPQHRRPATPQTSKQAFL